MIGLIFVGVLIMVLGVLTAVYPRMWWKASKWQYKDPEAVEPSEEAIGVNQFAGAGLVMLGLFITVGFWPLAKADHRQRAERERQEEVNEKPGGVVERLGSELMKEQTRVDASPRAIMAKARTQGLSPRDPTLLAEFRAKRAQRADRP